eukprot:CAMPEP_0170551034 /NCGR_PEP_ID=MMETSP0211-20121228/9050_1 /TAXON_ID=311385 /ORGANISM="Pseudokeronopsis sp., Strain OXSARD2" /LENGTH=170 /DNA_ID=CAMNT_0010857933 /DNA_START=672 /DNA_END=1184 /DNA_ORIENTATION=-
MNPTDQSELLFGAYNEDKFTGDINWHPVIDKLFWSLSLDDIKYNGVSIPFNSHSKKGLCDVKRCMVTPDSGTTLLTAPSWAIEAIKNALPYEEDCKSDTQFANLTFVIDGVDYDLPSHHFMERYTNVFEEGDSICMTSITDLDILQEGQKNLFIVGDTFMQIYYSIFDRE